MGVSPLSLSLVSYKNLTCCVFFLCFFVVVFLFVCIKMSYCSDLYISNGVPVFMCTPQFQQTLVLANKISFSSCVLDTPIPYLDFCVSEVV